MIQDYIDADIKPADVWPQSFLLDDVVLWAKEFPAYGQQAVFLDERDNTADVTSLAAMQSLYSKGVRVIGPAAWKMLTLDAQKKIVPSDYAKNAKAAGLKMIAWSLERSGPLNTGGGWYYQSISLAINNDGDMYTVIDVLAKDVGVIGIFTDWPATVTYYDNCMKQ